MARPSIAVLVGGVFLVACVEDEPAVSPSASESTTDVGSSDDHSAGRELPTDPNAPTYGKIELTTGFSPDPHVIRGTAGGIEDASEKDEACAGWISGTPDHEFVAGSRFGSFYAMAFSLHDVTLVIEKPDGTFACNDNAEGQHPLVPFENLSPGTYRLWVGSRERGRNSAYTLGLSELEGAKPSDLRAAE